MGRRAEASPDPNAILGASTPHSSTQTLIELALFTNSEQSRQGLPGPPSLPGTPAPGLGEGGVWFPRDKVGAGHPPAGTAHCWRWPR